MRIPKNILRFRKSLIALPFLAIVTWCSIPLELPRIPRSSVITDRNGERLAEIPFNGNIRHMETGHRVPDFFFQALVSIEDRRFYSHPWVDPIAILRSTWHNLQAGKAVEGGSTIPMQLVRNRLWLNESRGIGKKLLEAALAIRIRLHLPAEEILREYAQSVSFGHMNLGIESAADWYFGKPPESLAKDEQLALLVLPRDPERYDPINHYGAFEKRFDQLRDHLVRSGVLTETEGKAISTESLRFAYGKRTNGVLPYAVDAAKRFMPELGKNDTATRWRTIRLTIDAELTKRLAEDANAALQDIAWKNVSDYALVVADRRTSEVLALIGGVNFGQGPSGQVNSVFSLRQAGSAMKPFVYLRAFEKLGYTDSTIIEDLPVSYRTKDEFAYEPKNYSLDFQWPVSVRKALAESLNVPAIRTTAALGVPDVLGYFRTLGFQSLDQDADHYGLALGLGVGEIRLYDLVRAYSVFDNGKLCPFQYILSNQPGLLPGETPSRPDPELVAGSGCVSVASESNAKLVADMLSDSEARVRAFPRNSALDFGKRYVGIKTGTSRNYRDNWAIGFTRNYRIGVWAGNKNGENMHGVSGATGAGEIFARIVQDLEQEEDLPLAKSVNGGEADSNTRKNMDANAQKTKYCSVITPIPGARYLVGAKNTLVPKMQTNLPHDQIDWTWQTSEGKPVRNEKIPLDRLGPLKIRGTVLSNGEMVCQAESEIEVMPSTSALPH